MQFGKEHSDLIAANDSGAAVIFDVSEADFEEKVLKASMDIPVIVDFWAPWCGPCKQLGPALEKVVLEAKGAVRMAKVDIDQNQQIAAALRIQSIPTVYVFSGGRPVDGFQGNMPESQIRAFVDKIVKAIKAARPDAMDIPAALAEAAQHMADGNSDAAQEIYLSILEEDETNTGAYVGFVRTLIATGDLDQAQEVIDNAPGAIAKDSNFAEARSALELASVKPEGDFSALQQKLDSDPKDHQARFDLALAQFAGGAQEEAMDNLLHIISANRTWNEKAAHQQLLKIFEALGHDHPLTAQGRRKLSSLLFS